MQEHQYRWTLSNRWTYRPRAPFAQGRAAAGLLRNAARDLRRREQVEAALPSLLAAELLAHVRVRSVRDETVLLQIDSAAAAEEVRRQAPALERGLRRRVTGVARLRVASGAADDAHKEEKHAWS